MWEDFLKIHFVAAKMSIVLDGEWYEPATSSQPDIDAAERRNQFEVWNLHHNNPKKTILIPFNYMWNKN